MKCAYCKYNDGAVYTSNPPKYRCSVTGEYHLALDDCNVEFAPVKHGRWINEPNCWYRCSVCGEHYPSTRGYMYYNYCPKCGADMRGGEK